MALIPTKIKFFQVSVKMLFTDMMERTVDTTLKQGEIALRRVYMGFPSGVFLVRVLDFLVLKVQPQVAVGGEIVGHKDGDYRPPRRVQQTLPDQHVRPRQPGA
jgi:hypothetical protein